MPNERPYISKRIIREMAIRCNYMCPICGRTFFYEYYIDRNPENRNSDNILLLCPDCYSKEYLSASEYVNKKKRQNFCIICNRSFLSIHHIDGNPSNIELDNLILLCRSCHIRCDGKTSKKEIEEIKKLRDKWFSYCEYLLEF